MERANFEITLEMGPINDFQSLMISRSGQGWALGLGLGSKLYGNNNLPV
jgi:hypothetical protein